ncbi:MAG: glycosyltransferase [Pirellulales bacterium]|nr:glycosyltransferase [Pirellulales bacterium]
MSGNNTANRDSQPATIRAAMLNKSVSRSGTGVSAATRALAQAIAVDPHVNLEVLGIEDEHSREDLSEWKPVPTQVFPTYGPRAISYAPSLLKRLCELDPHLVHTHGLWVYTSVAAKKWAQRTGRPLLISPHGMLDPWAIRNSRWKKRLAGWLYENAHLRQANCLHALCESEAKAIREFGLDNPITIIPNGIYLPTSLPEIKPVWQSKLADGDKVLLFLSRIHPKKNLVGLLQGWSRVKSGTKPWHLAIAGLDEGGHELQLRQLSQQLGIEKKVHFIGPQFGPAKAAAYHHADAFVLPSFSEGLPMVVLEAWAYRLPALITPECNLPEGTQAGAVIETRTDPADIARSLERLFTMSVGERETIGEKGRRLVEDRFTWQQVAVQMRRLYDWLLQGGAPPETIWDF